MSSCVYINSLKILASFTKFVRYGALKNMSVFNALFFFFFRYAINSQL